jgi:hypothetical protein
MKFVACRATVVLTLLSTTAIAQSPPAVRALGEIDRVSDSLASVADAVPMPRGQVLVNDITAHRVLLYDSTFMHAFVVADSTRATKSAYGTGQGTLIPYRKDTALFIDPSSRSMLVLDAAGKVVRAVAIPRPNEALYLIGSAFGTPGFDARGRLVHFSPASVHGTIVLCCLGTSRRSDIAFPGDTARPNGSSRIVPMSDSAYVIRVDLASKVVDTAASIKVASTKLSMNYDSRGFTKSIEETPDPLPMVDDWTVLPDGTIAVVRGRDYHVDWILPDGTRQSSPAMPFDWQRVDDQRKLALIDSAVQASQVSLDITNARLASTGRAGGTPIPLVTGRPELSDLPDSIPPFTRGAVRADCDGNVWIRTSTIVRGQPVYDIVNRRGELVDRVQLPAYRTLAGFAPGAVYMSVRDATGMVHLERASVR